MLNYKFPRRISIEIYKKTILKQIATELRRKRVDILKSRGKEVRWIEVEHMLVSPNLEPESLQRQILRFRQKAEII